MVALPLSPHEFDCASCSNLGRRRHWNIVRAVDANVAGNSIGLNFGSVIGHDDLEMAPMAYSEQAVCDGSIVLELARDLVHARLLRVLVGVPSIDEILA